MEMHGEQPALDEIGLLRLAQADRAVRLAHGQVEFLVGQDQLQADLRIELDEFLHALGQPAGAKPTVVVTLSTPEGLSLASVSRDLDRLQLHQHVMRRAEQQLALFGQHQAAGMAIEQRHADIMFQRADLPRDRRLRQMQRLGGMGERPSFRCSVKHA